MKKHNFKTFSLYQIRDRENIPFDPREYSMFKYGSKSTARKYGRELGNSLYNALIMTGLPKDCQLIVLPSPYFFVPTATFALKDYMIATMNRKMIQAGYINPIQESKVFRKNSYNTEYGSMSFEERRQAIGSETFHVDVEFLSGKHVIFLDDIFITGSHEERMEEMIQRLGIKEKVKDILFVYFAERVSENVEPSIEGELNMKFVSDLYSIDYIIKNDEFLFNTRNLKFILKSPEEEFSTFIRFQSDKFRETLLSYSLANGYHLDDSFEKNINFLNSFTRD